MHESSKRTAHCEDRFRDWNLFMIHISFIIICLVLSRGSHTHTWIQNKDNLRKKLFVGTEDKFPVEQAILESSRMYRTCAWRVLYKCVAVR